MKPGSNTILTTPHGVPITAKTYSQGHIVTAILKHDVVFVVGAAGSGKSYVSIALALAALESKSVKKIILTRPAVEAGEHLGFLPGSLHEKIEPYLMPLYDALNEMRGKDKVQEMLANGVLEIVPLAYMRGRTLSASFIVADEMQNATYAQLKMLVTRIGMKSKMIINGDRTQTDLYPARLSCLHTADRVMSHVPGIDFVYMNPSEIVRHGVVAEIVSAYEIFEATNEETMLAMNSKFHTNGNGVSGH